MQCCSLIFICCLLPIVFSSFILAFGCIIWHPILSGVPCSSVPKICTPVPLAGYCFSLMDILYNSPHFRVRSMETWSPVTAAPKEKCNQYPILSLSFLFFLAYCGASFPFWSNILLSHWRSFPKILILFQHGQKLCSSGFSSHSSFFMSFEKKLNTNWKET